MIKFRKILLIVLVLGFTTEVGLLVKETYTYTKYKYCSLTINGRIVAEIDNLFNFSGMMNK